MTEMEERDSLSHTEDTNWDLTDQIKLLCEENHHPGPYRPAPPCGLPVTGCADYGYTDEQQ